MWGCQGRRYLAGCWAECFDCASAHQSRELCSILADRTEWPSLASLLVLATGASTKIADMWWMDAGSYSSRVIRAIAHFETSSWTLDGLKPGGSQNVPYNNSGQKLLRLSEVMRMSISQPLHGPWVFSEVWFRSKCHVKTSKVGTWASQNTIFFSMRCDVCSSYSLVGVIHPGCFIWWFATKTVPLLIIEAALLESEQTKTLIQTQPRLGESDAAAQVFYNLGLCYAVPWSTEGRG